MNESLKNLINSNQLLKTRFNSEPWKEYLCGLSKLFEHTNIDGFEWYRTDYNLCFSSQFGKSSVIMFLRLQKKCPVIVLSRNKQDQETIEWPFFKPNGIEIFCTRWKQFWTESRINNYHNQTYQNLIKLLMAPVENITSETNDQQTAISINKICAQSSCEPQPNLDTAGTEINVNGLVESIKKMVGDSELKLAGYNIGITLNSTRRQGQYRGVGMKYFKVLCSSLSSYEAIAIEEIVHTELTHNQSSITYRKYRANACGRYRANLGGRRHTKEKIYDFYIAWWQEGEPGFSR